MYYVVQGIRCPSRGSLTDGECFPPVMTLALHSLYLAFNQGGVYAAVILMRRQVGFVLLLLNGCPLISDGRVKAVVVVVIPLLVVTTAI